MSAAEDEELQFQRDMAKAIELSKRTAAQERERRKHYTVLPMTISEEDDYGGRITPTPVSQSSTQSKRTESVKPMRPPAPLPATILRSKTVTSANTSSGLDKPQNNTTVDTSVVRPRPRGSLAGRTLSPSALHERRSGFICSPETESPRNSPLTISAPPVITTSEIKNETKRPVSVNDPWNQFTDDFSKMVFDGKDPFAETSNNHLSLASTLSDPFNTARNPFSSNNPFATTSPSVKSSSSHPDLLKTPGSLEAAGSHANLINFSPMNKDKLNQHYKLDLDSLFAKHKDVGGLSASNSDLSSSWPSSNGVFSHQTSTTNSISSKTPGLQPATTSMKPTTGASNTPPPIPARESIKSSRAPFDVSQFFTDVVGRPGSPQPNSLNMLVPSTSNKPPTILVPPPLPSRQNSNQRVQRSNMQIKRVSTPSSDLLDLSEDVKIPTVPSVDLFDPLCSPKDDPTRRMFDEHLSMFNERMANMPAFTMSEGTGDDGIDDSESLLQDPFSYEELNMALMVASKIKGNDVVSIEDVTEREEVDPLYDMYENLSTSQSGIPEIPATPTSEIPGGAEGKPPRPSKPRSLSVTYSSNSLPKVSAPFSMDEFTAFSVMVARLKAEYKCDDKYTNVGLLFSPTIRVPKLEGRTVEVIVFTDKCREPITFYTDVNSSVEIIIWNVMSNISADFLEISVDDYILKVFGYSEFLVNDSNLGDYAYVHNCLKCSDPIRFSLHEVNSLEKPFLRVAGDDEEPIYMIKDELHGDKSYKVQPKDLKVLHDLFTEHTEKVNSVALEKKPPTVKGGLNRLNITTLLQAIKAITSVLLGDETQEIKLAIKRLKDTLHQVDNSIYDDRRFAMLMGDFQSAMDDLRNGVKQLIKMYCSTFRVNFSHFETEEKAREVKDVTNSGENLLVQVCSVHRLPARIRSKFDQYKVKVSLYYGGKSIASHIDTDIYSSLENRGTDTIYFDQWLEFADFKICTAPLETRLMFTLCAMNTTQPVSGSGRNVPNRWTAIGWVALTLFDFRRNLSQGGKLLSLWSDAPNPSGPTESNIWSPKTVLLQVNLTDFGYDLRFPALIDSPRRPKLHDDTEEQTLSDDVLSRLEDIMIKEDREIDEDDKEFLWSSRDELTSIPEVLSKVLLSAPHYHYSGIHLIQEVLNSWKMLTPLEALTLLLPDFPCQQTRAYAVKCLKNASSDELCDYLPQLVQALKFENHHDSSLAQLLLERSITSVRLAQQLYWAFKDAAGQVAHRERYKIMFGGLVSVMGKSLRQELENEEALVKQCNHLAESVKQTRDSKDKVMGKEIISICDLLKSGSMRLPTNPGQEVNSLDLKLCTYFNSFTVPLKLVFKNMEFGASNHYLMYKVGDDLRQDMIVMQLISIMDKLWLQNKLDLRIVTFRCLPTGDKRGMVELINECETLRKIQTSGGITGSFKDQPLANWLQKHNPTHGEYNRAVENFTLSCAGYCVATYILGIGDRHNDNIMVKRTGHIFHIDFAKFLGDAQMFGNFKRDRTPFVLTPDMAYVINGGDKATLKFQEFIDLCCEAFNAIRDNAEGIITLLTLMTSSGVNGVTAQAVQYVRNALLPEQTNAEATASFTRMIEESLQSRFVQVNFFLHNLAQLKFSSHSDGGLLSFIPTTYSMATDGRIINVEIFDYQKRYHPEKHYVYIIKVHREHKKEASFVYRRYSEFQEFYTKLVTLFPLANIPKLPGSVRLGRTHVQKVAERRKAELETFLRQLLMQAQEISEHDLIYTFFHPMLRDEKEVVPAEPATFKDTALRPNIKTITGEVKLSIQYKNHVLHVLVMHAKDLSEKGDRLNPYVKLYLLPDPIKSTKRKTKISSSTNHPTYNEMFEYRLPLSEARQRTLQVTIWSAELTGNEFLGAVHISLYDTDISKEWIAWHKLSTLHKISF